MKLDPYLIPYTNVNSKWIKDLNLRAETIKLLGKKTGENLLYLVLGTYFLELTPKAQAKKAKINKEHYTKLKSFCTAKETINRMKRQPTKWRKYLQTTYLIVS